MTEPEDVLLKHWEDQRAKFRHSEDQRSSLTNMILVIASVALGFVAQRGLSEAMLAVTLPLVAVGGYGALCSVKLAERASLHNAHARAISDRLDELMPGLRLAATYSRARSGHRKRFGRLSRVRLRHLWTALHLGVALIGLGLSAAIVL